MDSLSRCVRPWCSVCFEGSWRWKFPVNSLFKIVFHILLLSDFFREIKQIKEFRERSLQASQASLKKVERTQSVTIKMFLHLKKEKISSQGVTFWRFTEITDENQPANSHDIVQAYTFFPLYNKIAIKILFFL